MTTQIRYQAITSSKGRISGEWFPEMLEDRPTLSQALNDARIDYAADVNGILAVISIDTKTGDVTQIHNRKQLTALFDAEDQSITDADHEDLIYGSYSDQMYGWKAAL